MSGSVDVCVAADAVHPARQKAPYVDTLNADPESGTGILSVRQPHPDFQSHLVCRGDLARRGYFYTQTRSDHGSNSTHR